MDLQPYLFGVVFNDQLEVAQELDDFSVLVKWYHTFDFFRFIVFFVNLFQVKKAEVLYPPGGSVLNWKY